MGVFIVRADSPNGKSAAVTEPISAVNEADALLMGKRLLTQDGVDLAGRHADWTVFVEEVTE